MPARTREPPMPPRVTWHKSLTDSRILDAVQREMSTLDNPGFCLSCGEEAYECEPDARRYKCELCGERAVYGAQELLFDL